MLNGMVGRKIGMTQIFTDNGVVIPVTVVQVGPMTVLQKKTIEKDGYESVQMGFEDLPKRKINKPMEGHFKDLAPKRVIKEFRALDASKVERGQQFDSSIFGEGEMITVTGVSKGKGFQGVMKRHNFSGQPATHGHRGHRVPGSIGQRTTPGRVYKGKRLPGHMGSEQVTTSGLKIVKIIAEQNLVLVKGAIPGQNGGIVTLMKVSK